MNKEELFFVHGLQELIDWMRVYPEEFQRKAVKNAMGKAASKIRKAATAKAPKRSGDMAKNIRVQYASRTSRRTGDTVFRIGVRGGAQQPGTQTRFARTRKGKKAGISEGGSTWYWRLVEFGTQKMKAQPFMRPAMTEDGYAVLNQISSELSKSLLREGKKEAQK